MWIKDNVIYCACPTQGSAMERKGLYRHLLRMIEPWTVERVELDMTSGQVDVHVGHAGGTRFACPECGLALAVYDHSGERTWRHLDSCQFLTYLHASPPRVSCPEHGVRQMWTSHALVDTVIV